MQILKFFSPLAAALASVTTLAPIQASADAGSYLAARHASFFFDFKAAAQYYSRAIAADPTNLALMEDAVLAQMSLGEHGRAAAVARRITQLGAESQVAALALVADGIKRERFEQVLEDIEAGLTVGPLVDGLLKAWAQLGAGRMSDALASFDEVSQTSGIEIFGHYHKALALAMVGDYEGSAAILSGEAHGPLQLTRRGVVAYAQVLSQLERNGDAVELIDASFGAGLDQSLAQLRFELEAGKPIAFDAVTNSQDGAAEVFLVVAGALNGEANDNYTLLFARTAEYLRPDHIDAILLTAALLESMERHALATEVYAKVPRDDPSFSVAELGRVEALRRSGDVEGAIAALRALAEIEPDNPEIHMTLGDTLRREERYDEASKAYDAAIAMIETPEQPQWLWFFARGITHEREDRWELAEADFRKALDLNPGQPQVLNYLGYSFLELDRNLDEAIEMIAEAVAAEPDSGYIVDSLGWGQFLTGDYANAVLNLERAAELMAVDPIVNDHLGDAYWAVGRRIEAEFQWRRALSFDPEEKDADRIRRKLEIGLDAVLEEEGADPLQTTGQEG